MIIIIKTTTTTTTTNDCNRLAPLQGRPVNYDRSMLAERLHARRQIDHVPLFIKRREQHREIGRLGIHPLRSTPRRPAASCRITCPFIENGTLRARRGERLGRTNNQSTYTNNPRCMGARAHTHTHLYAQKAGARGGGGVVHEEGHVPRRRAHPHRCGGAGAGLGGEGRVEVGGEGEDAGRLRLTNGLSVSDG